VEPGSFASLTLPLEVVVTIGTVNLLGKAALLEKIAEMVNDKKLEGISDLRDESDRDGIRVVSNYYLLPHGRFGLTRSEI